MEQQKLLLSGVFLVMCGLMLWAIPAVVAQDDDGETDTENVAIVDDEIQVAIEPTGKNGYCTICHDQPLRTTRLADGTILNLYVNPGMIIGSVHGPTEDSPGLGCLDCHGEDAFPHNDAPPTDGRVYTLEMNNLCTSCHVEQSEDLSMGLHAMAISEGNMEAAVCTDCHSAHHVQTVENFPQLVAGVCGDCHENALHEWQISAHADIGPLGCASCHNHHAQTLRVGETTTELCLNCHQDNMPEDLYVHETHLDGANAVSCEECHMATGTSVQLVSSEPPVESMVGHSMLLDSTPCTECHEQLIANGEWTRIISERYALTLQESPEAADVEDGEHSEDDDHGDDDDSANNLLTLQGLLVGLGLGVTLTIVFVTRSQRRTA